MWRPLTSFFQIGSAKNAKSRTGFSRISFTETELTLQTTHFHNARLKRSSLILENSELSVNPNHPRLLSVCLLVSSTRSQALQEAVEEREESLSWLKRRLAALSEVSPELEVQRERAALAKLSTDLRALLSSLCQVKPPGLIPRLP